MFRLDQYPYFHFLIINVYSIICARFVSSAYVVPDAKLEALEPKGFRFSIPHEPGIKYVAFHGKINAMLNDSEPGELNAEISMADGNFWVYYNPDIALHVGDFLSYWIFVQHGYAGYRRDKLTWEVKELHKESSLKCLVSETISESKAMCKGALIFHDSFDTLDQSKWVIEKYIPNSGPNFDFNSYVPECTKAENSTLKITPVPKLSEDDLRGILDLSDGCTSPNSVDCYFRQQAAFFLPPVSSGKITSKFSFKYGKVELLAQLPMGDWLYPEITLTPKSQSSSLAKIYIAYSRGNRELKGNDGTDIGGQLLLAGPSVSPYEPKRSQYLFSTRNSQPFSTAMHKYTLIWTPQQITAFVDDVHFGEIKLDSIPERDLFEHEFNISLGVGVGGINEFPNDYISGNYVKPWRNKDAKQVKNFFGARQQWLSTWDNHTCGLIVDSIRVYSLL